MKRSSGWNQEVTDAQGRRRFHGAFTGGFSAGYYNSVGTEEGWQPATFESSRASRNARSVEQRAEDFMDEEDDPLLGKRLETAEAYDTLQTTARQRAKDGILGDSSAAQRREMAVLLVPDELVMPAGGDSIGKKLLSQMGWKEGHGIGPKLRRKLKMDAEDQANDAQDREDDVFVPPRNTIDAKVFPKPKLDKYGAGFDPFVDAPEFLRHKQQQQQPESKAASARQVVTFAQALGAGGVSSRVAMGFGLSALEDSDDLDVYDTTSMDEFDRAIAPAGESVKLLDSMSNQARAKKRQQEFEASATLCSDGRLALPGFRIAIKKEKPPQSVSQRLDVPSDFRAYHVFDEREEASGVNSLYGKFNFSTEKSGRGSMMTAKLRAQILDGAVPPAGKPDPRTAGTSSTGSVFDMLDPAQREKLMGAAQAVKERKPLTQGAPSEQFRANVSASIAKRFVSASTTESGSEQMDSPLTGGISTVKKSYRTESDWAPHVLLCKRFHVKCQGLTISGGKDTSDDAGQDLFTKELAPHLLDLAAAGRHASEKGREDAAVASLGEKPKRVDDTDVLPPLPVASKPSTDLLRSIFEPSDESAMEEEDSADEEEPEDAEVVAKDQPGVSNTDAVLPTVASVSGHGTAATDLTTSGFLGEDSCSSSSESSDEETTKKRKRSDQSEERSSKKHKRSKHKKDKDSKKSKKKKSKKSTKSSHGHSDRDSSSRSSRRDRDSRRSRSRSRSRDRKRSGDRSRDRK